MPSDHPRRPRPVDDDAEEAQAELQRALARVKDLEERAARLGGAWATVDEWCKKHGLAAFYAAATWRGATWWRAHTDDSPEVCRGRGNAPWRFFYRRSPEDVAMYWGSIAELKVGETTFRMERSNQGPVRLYANDVPVFAWGRNQFSLSCAPPGTPLESMLTVQPWESDFLGAPKEELSAEARMLLALATPVQLGVLFCELCRVCGDTDPRKIPCLHDEACIRALWSEGTVKRVTRM